MGSLSWQAVRAVALLMVVLTSCTGSDVPTSRPAAVVSSVPAGAAPTLADVPDDIEAVLVHPPMASVFSCSEHAVGDVKFLGDALGTDCFVLELTEDGWSSLHGGDGSDNADWYSWGEPLLAPFDGVVERVVINAVTNEPGSLGDPPASSIRFLRADGTRVTYAHIAEVTVDQGDNVTAGQAVAVIGNNGFGRSPHVHIGAWRGTEPLQLRFDLHAMGKLRSEP